MAEVKPRGLRFVKRVYPARIIGLGLGAIVIAVALLPQQPPLFLWLLLGFNGFVWPHFAYYLASIAANPYRIERFSLLADAVLGGFWLVAMGLNPLASSVLIMMLWMNMIAAGGVKFFASGVLSTAAGLLVGLLLLEFHWQPQVSNAVIYAAIPMLISCPILIGLITYNLSMQLHRQKELLKHLSRTDSLTDIFNRGYWEVRAREEIVRVRRSHSPLCLLLIDIDHFKAVNDTYGHGMGDRVLQQVAQYLQWNLRESELLGRYGGEEFGIILPDEDLTMAWQLGERLRLFIEQAEFQDPADPGNTHLRCTISIGVAAFSDSAGDFSSWVRAADAALYQAKRMGRNRCVMYESVNCYPLEERV
ncbi:MAG TPA: diguanylate cyclase [Cellvibrio sp.]|nr:diguanylate cyclase [Cellvibrio sp.]